MPTFVGLAYHARIVQNHDSLSVRNAVLRHLKAEDYVSPPPISALAVIAACILWSASACAAAMSLAFDFERDNTADGWYSTTPDAITISSANAKFGTSSLHISNVAASGAEFITFARDAEPMRGQFLELRAFVRSASVSGYGGLWLRQDKGGKPLLLDNMHGRGLSGTSDWQLLRIRQEIVKGADKIAFGGLLVGTGEMWFDDIELFSSKGVPDEGMGSDINLSPPEISNEQAQYLALLIRVWSFLKFHHASVTSGAVDWDAELIRLLPGIIDSGSRATAIRTIEIWVSELEAHSRDICIPGPKNGPDTLPENAKWISEKEVVGKRLSSLLVTAYQARCQERQYFISIAPGIGNTIPTNERQYAQSRLPSPALRILSIARIWSAIEYWSPYRELAQTPWYSVLAEAISSAMDADTEVQYHHGLLKLIAKINDGHAFIMSSVDHRPPAGSCYLPAIIRLVENQPVVVSASPGSRLKPGDAIISLNNISFSEIAAHWLPFYSASSEAARISEVATYLNKGYCEEVEIAVIRDGERASFSASRANIVLPEDLVKHDLPGAAFQMLGPKIGYLKLSAATKSEIYEHLDDGSVAPENLIIDLRGYPREFLLFELAGRLVSSPTPFAKISSPSLTHPGEFTLSDTTVIQPVGPKFRGKVAVLVDESTISQAEYTAMALRAAGAVIIGSPSAGADGNVSTVNLPGGLAIRFSGIGIFYPDGSPTQGAGIIPDISVNSSIKGVRNCRDEVLEAAILHLAGEADSRQGAVSVCRDLTSLDF